MERVRRTISIALATKQRLLGVEVPVNTAKSMDSPFWVFFCFLQEIWTKVALEYCAGGNGDVLVDW